MPAATCPSRAVQGAGTAAMKRGSLCRASRPWCLLFLGSTIGNLNQTEADVFWRKSRCAMSAAIHC